MSSQFSYVLCLCVSYVNTFQLSIWLGWNVFFGWPIYQYIFYSIFHWVNLWWIPMCVDQRRQDLLLAKQRLQARWKRLKLGQSPCPPYKSHERDPKISGNLHYPMVICFVYKYIYIYMLMLNNYIMWLYIYDYTCINDYVTYYTLIMYVSVYKYGWHIMTALFRQDVFFFPKKCHPQWPQVSV